ncbi:MAG TPA: hypothetical protein VKN99_08850 [Polyangia bacterium]|nr:hypothetical protein [Polyangia bacterium]
MWLKQIVSLLCVIGLGLAGCTSGGGGGGSGGSDGGAGSGGSGGMAGAGGAGGAGGTGGFGGGGGSGGSGGLGGSGGAGGAGGAGGTGGGSGAPGEINCRFNGSGATCTPGQICCVTLLPQTSGTCVSGNSCPSGQSPFRCDGPEDCSGGQCCLNFNPAEASCMPTCGGNLSQVCHSMANCPPGMQHCCTTAGVPSGVCVANPPGGATCN